MDLDAIAQKQGEALAAMEPSVDALKRAAYVAELYFKVKELQEELAQEHVYIEHAREALREALTENTALRERVAELEAIVSASVSGREAADPPADETGQEKPISVVGFTKKNGRKQE